MTQMSSPADLRPAEPAAPASDELPYLADDIELIGRYADSGYRDAPYLVRRGDGQTVQVSELIYLVAAALGESGDPDEVAALVSAGYGRDVSPDNVAYLAEKKLRPAGLLWSPDPSPGDTPQANPLLALRLRLPLVPERLHRPVTGALTGLFRLPVVLAVLTCFATLDAWLAVAVGADLLDAPRQLIYQPQLLLPMTLLTIGMAGFHEFGHAAATRYGGARPGAMGAGIYLVWPVFYTDVTDAYRLDRRGRLRVDLGGIYFNLVFVLSVGGLYLLTGHVFFLVFILLAHVETLRQFLPFVRLDGYYIVSDLAGVPNLFAYLKPAVRRLGRLARPGTWRSARRPDVLDQLTPRARTILLLWSCVTVPVLLVNVALILFYAPALAGATWGSAELQLDGLAAAAARHDAATVASGVFGLLFLVLPVAGMAYVSVRLVRQLVARAQGWWARRPVPTAVVAAAAVTAVVLHVGLAWPETFVTAAQRHDDPDPQGAETRDGVVPPLVGGGGHLTVAGMEAAALGRRLEAEQATPPPPAPPAPEPERPASPAGVGDTGSPPAGEAAPGDQGPATADTEVPGPATGRSGPEAPAPAPPGGAPGDAGGRPAPTRPEQPTTTSTTSTPPTRPGPTPTPSTTPTTRPAPIEGLLELLFAPQGASDQPEG